MIKEQTPQRILIVDDDKLVTKTITRMILKMGYSCDAVLSGEEALERLQKEHFDIVLSDIQMKGMNGIEFMKSAKERFPELDFIIMTSYTSEYSYIDIIKAGAVDYLAKPFEWAELEARLERVVKDRRLLSQVKESEKRYSILVESSPDIIYTLDPKGNFSFVGGAVKELLGFTPEELLGKHVASIVYPQELDMSYWDLNEWETEGNGNRKRQLRFNAKEGKPRWFALCCMPIYKSASGSYDQSPDVKEKTFIGTYGVARDITERKHVQEALEESHNKLEQVLRKLKETQTQMLQSEKMASIGQLAAGVAHEINNPTGFISSNLNTLAGYDKDLRSLIAQYSNFIAGLKDDMATEKGRALILEKLGRINKLENEIDIDFILSDIPNLIKESRDGTERIRKIVINLKDFAHPGDQKLKYADINTNLDSTLNIVWNELKYNATVIKEYGQIPEVRCYPQQLNQVFMNLLVNAAQAIEKQGEIKIATRALDGKVEIKISDTGKGISEENLSKIFDPFFTTKEVGKGTGLGLNVAYNIIEKHKGTIDVESTVGKGTTFTIQIPIGE